MNQLTKKLLSIFMLTTMFSLPVKFNVFACAEKMRFIHEPIILPEKCKRNRIACRYNDEISRAIIEHFYEERTAYNNIFHPEKLKTGEITPGLIYSFNELNGVPLIIHSDENDHVLIIDSESWSREGKNFQIILEFEDEILVPIFYYYDGERNNKPLVIEQWDF